MKHGFLSDYFRGVAVKKLSIVETNPASMNSTDRRLCASCSAMMIAGTFLQNSFGWEERSRT